MILHVEVQGRNCKLTHNVLEFVFEFTFTLPFTIFIVSFICNDNVYFVYQTQAYRQLCYQQVKRTKKIYDFLSSFGCDFSSLGCDMVPQHRLSYHCKTACAMSNHKEMFNQL